MPKLPRKIGGVEETSENTQIKLDRLPPKVYNSSTSSEMGSGQNASPRTAATGGGINGEAAPPLSSESPRPIKLSLEKDLRQPLDEEDAIDRAYREKDKELREDKRALIEVIKSAEAVNQWGQVAERVARALGQISAAQYGLKYKVRMDGLKFEETDWQAARQSTYNLLKTSLDDIATERSLALKNAISMREAAEKRRAEQSKRPEIKTRKYQDPQKGNNWYEQDYIVTASGLQNVGEPRYVEKFSPPAGREPRQPPTEPNPEQTNISDKIKDIKTALDPKNKAGWEDIEATVINSGVFSPDEQAKIKADVEEKWTLSSTSKEKAVKYANQALERLRASRVSTATRRPVGGTAAVTSPPPAAEETDQQKAARILREREEARKRQVRVEQLPHRISR